MLFWNHVFELNEVIDIPWCLIGDVNELANPCEKREGQNYSSSKFLRLNNFISRINVASVLVSGSL